MTTAKKFSFVGKYYYTVQFYVANKYIVRMYLHVISTSISKSHRYKTYSQELFLSPITKVSQME